MMQGKCGRVLVLAFLGILTVPGRSIGQTADSAGGFGQRFSGEDRSLPTFTRPGATPPLALPSSPAEEANPAAEPAPVIPRCADQNP